MVNQVITRDEKGHLVVDTACPMLVESRSRTDQSKQYNGYDVVIWEVAEQRCGGEVNVRAALGRQAVLATGDGDKPSSAFPKVEVGREQIMTKTDAYERGKAVANVDFLEFDEALNDWVGESNDLQVGGNGAQPSGKLTTMSGASSSGLQNLFMFGGGTELSAEKKRITDLEQELVEKKDKLSRADTLTEGLLGKALEAQPPRPPKVDEYIKDLSATAENANRLLCDMNHVLRFKKHPETKQPLTATEYEDYNKRAQTMLESLLVESKSLRGSLSRPS